MLTRNGLIRSDNNSGGDDEKSPIVSCHRLSEMVTKYCDLFVLSVSVKPNEFHHVVTDSNFEGKSTVKEVTGYSQRI